MTTPDVPTAPSKGLLTLVVGLVIVSIIVLMVDWKIKQEILTAANKVKEDTERFARLYYAGTSTPLRDPAVSDIGASSSGGDVVDRTAGMEAPVSLADHAKGMGRKVASAPRDGNGRWAPHTGAGERSVEVPDEPGPVEP